MRFNYFLTTYLPRKDYGGDRLYQELIQQAVKADELGYDAISIPEHHLVNILLVPSPLQMAAKLACLTREVDIVTSIAVLPVRDMRIFAGEVVQADILCDSRLTLGVGRGAFGYELERLGTPLSLTREKFDESLAVLEALLSSESVSWNGSYYKFDELTVMPRPVRKIPIMVAAMIPEAIYSCARKGYDVQTTPLQASHDVLLEQVNAFRRGKAEAPERSFESKLALQRVLYLARDEADAERVGRIVYDYYKLFDNVFSGPGQVSKGMIDPLPRKQSFEEMMDNVLICTKSRMIDMLGSYADAGIDEIIMSCGFGQKQEEMLDMMNRFATEIMPHFRKLPSAKPVVRPVLRSSL
jgi:alkanesulfonate monooxygenase SsuD/methylene tetrahydromethanopterin reductase-like flavin-dependent oxidoreductase (luciferase family)